MNKDKEKQIIEQEYFLELQRIKMGNLELPNNLKLGECRELTEKEMKKIRE